MVPYLNGSDQSWEGSDHACRGPFVALLPASASRCVCAAYFVTHEWEGAKETTASRGWRHGE
jgi:hypothetical protein